MYLKYLETKSTAKDSHFLNSNSVIDSILQELEHFNSRSKVFISNGCEEIKITPSIDNIVSHFIILKLDKNLTASVLSHSLPSIDKLFKPFGTIESFVTTFFSILEHLEQFYVEMNTIDELCYVVDPMEITTKCNYRIIKLDNRVYLKIMVDPLVPSSITTNFYGPTKSIEQFRNLYRDGINEWNIKDDIYRNLLRIFDMVSFPQKSIFEPDFDTNCNEHCSICYMYRLCDQIPIISCDNEKCNLIYHTICLREWFSTIRESKTFLNVTSGRCPFCKEKLSTSFAQLLDL